VIDATTNSLIATIPLDGGAGNTVYDPGSGQILVAVHAAEYSVRDQPTMPLAAKKSRSDGTRMRGPCGTGRGSNRLNFDRTVYQTNEALFSTDTKARLG